MCKQPLNLERKNAKPLNLERKNAKHTWGQCFQLRGGHPLGLGLICSDTLQRKVLANTTLEGWAAS